MLDFDVKQQLENDFEQYMRKFYASFKRFSLEDFGTFASTVINYYVQNRVVEVPDRSETAYFLTSLYNKGMGNRITEEHLQLISTSIANDYTIDFNVIKLLFD